MEKLADPLLKVKLSECDIFIGSDLLELLSTRLKQKLAGEKLFIITQLIIADLYLPVLKQELLKKNIDFHVVMIPDGERAKSIDTYSLVTQEILSFCPTRKSMVLSFGGGVVGDLAGFVSSTILRGINIVQLPTTLLSQVDSSVGGKNGINTRHGKNMLGTFYHPELVFCDINFFKTLPEREYIAGCAEMVKHALICDIEFFNWVGSHAQKILQRDGEYIKFAIHRSIKIKSSIVLNDEKVGGRDLLNLGHTFGHALEAACSFEKELLHGEAVSIGISLAYRLANKIGICGVSCVTKVEACFRKLSLPTNLSDRKSSVSVKEVIKFINMDKKNDKGILKFVLPTQIGNVEVVEWIKPDLLQGFLIEEMQKA
jgi:3-dehydroquinate synthase